METPYLVHSILPVIGG